MLIHILPLLATNKTLIHDHYQPVTWAVRRSRDFHSDVDPLFLIFFAASMFGSTSHSSLCPRLDAATFVWSVLWVLSATDGRRSCLRIIFYVCNIQRSFLGNWSTSVEYSGVVFFCRPRFGHNPKGLSICYSIIGFLGSKNGGMSHPRIASWGLQRIPEQLR